MKIKELYSLLQGQEGINFESREDVDFSYVFAGDLMSDVLAKVNNDGLSNRSNKISVTSNNQILFPAYTRIQNNIARNGGVLFLSS